MLIHDRLRRLARLARRRISRADREGGFILLESIIAIALITVIMSAVGAEFVTSLSASTHARQQTVAAQLAESTIEQLHSIVPSSRGTGVDPTTLLANRTKSLVDTEYQALSALPNVTSKLQPMSVSAGSSWTPSQYEAFVGTSSGTPNVPTTATPTTIGTTNYSVWRYLQCSSPANSGSCASTSGAANNIQAFVVITWADHTCSSSTCSIVTSALFNDDPDPTFDLKQPAPNLPKAVLPSTLPTTTNSTCNPGGTTYQVSVSVNDPVSIALGVATNYGVPPFTWAANQLPTNVSIANPTGGSASIAGTVGGSATPSGSPLCTTLTVQDAFSSTATPRIDTVYLAWTIAPALSFTVGNRANIVNDQVNLPLNATGGSGSYTFSPSTDPRFVLPPTLSVSGSSVTGTITRPSPVPNTYTPQLTVSDTSSCPACANGSHATVTTGFTWSVGYGPVVVTNPGTQTATVNTALTAGKQLRMAAVTSGGDGTYAWSSTSNGTQTLPAGLTLNSSTGVVSGTPTQAGNFSVTITATDTSANVSPTSVTFTWSVVNAPSFTNTINARTDTIGASVSFGTAPTCPDAPCTYTVSGGPSGLTVAADGTVSGTIGGTAQTYGSAKIVATDSAGAQSSTNSFAWTVVNPPSFVGLPTAQVTALGSNASLTVNVSCPDSPCTYTLQNAPTGLSMNNATSTTALISGRVSAPSKVFRSVTMTITDAEGISQTSNTFVWTVTTTLPAAYDTVGITKNSGRSSGNFDGSNNSYSYDSIVSNGGPAAGAPLTVNGLSYVWPTSAGSGSPDDVSASGEVIAYPVAGLSSLGFLISATGGAVSGSGNIVYTDGSSQSYTLSAPNWTTNQTSYAVKAAMNSASSTTTTNVFVVGQQVSLTSTKPIAYVELPNSPNLHVFALSQPPLASFFNTTGIATKSTASQSNLDGGGYSLSYEAITAAGGPAAGATVSKSGVGPTYLWPSTAGTGNADTFAATTTTTVPFTASGSSALGLLVTGVNGSPSGDTVTVNYTSGAATTGTISTVDWCQSAGSASVFTAGYRYYKDGSTNGCTTSVNYALVPNVDASRTIKSIVLPVDAKLRVFAIGYGS